MFVPEKMISVFFIQLAKKAVVLSFVICCDGAELAQARLILEEAERFVAVFLRSNFCSKHTDLCQIGCKMGQEVAVSIEVKVRKLVYSQRLHKFTECRIPTIDLQIQYLSIKYIALHMSCMKGKILH